jgi:hypothetical protein
MEMTPAQAAAELKDFRDEYYRMIPAEREKRGYKSMRANARERQEALWERRLAALRMAIERLQLG